MVDESVRLAAVQKILNDRDEWLMRRLEIRQSITALEVDDRIAARMLADLRAAGRVFEQHVAVPVDLENFESFETLSKAMKELRQGQDWAPGESRPVTKEEKARLQKLATELDAEQAPAHQNDQNFVPPAKSTISEMVLEYLQSHRSGVGAATIREWLAIDRGVTTHEKTVGMTLYRLSKLGQARRNGRKWFPAATKAENPGGETPGQLSMLNEERKVDDV